MSEEERRRKIIIDSELIRAAAQDQARAMNGWMSGDEGRALIALDEEWLERRREILGEGS
jgi:hypothetical protein